MTAPWLAISLGPTRPVERIEPTDEERRNGWTVDALSEYVAERRAAEEARIDPQARRKPRPQWANGSKWHWRRTPGWRV
ncbi:MAG: hypothetical protein O7I42_15545 [Alphaproteobacteria bacterium]|nr:hypothetical protein [Alphaproteobacteria bacterium]